MEHHPRLKPWVYELRGQQLAVRAETHARRPSPGGPKSTEEVRHFGVLVAIQDVQALAPHERSHLADSCLPRSCLAHQKHWLRALEAPTHTTGISCLPDSVHKQGDTPSSVSTSPHVEQGIPNTHRTRDPHYCTSLVFTITCVHQRCQAIGIIPVNQGIHAAHAGSPHDATQRRLQCEGVRIGVLQLQLQSLLQALSWHTSLALVQLLRIYL